MSDFFRTHCEPDYADWESILASCDRAAVETKFGSDYVKKLRAAIVSHALTYTRQLSDLLPELPDPVLPSAPEQCPILMSGHQPVIYHDGILHKQTLLERYATEHPVTAIHVIIDTDVENAGCIYYPTKREGQLKIKQLSLASGQGLIMAQKVADPDTLNAVFSTVAEGMALVGYPVPEAFRTARHDYQRLSGKNLSRANTAIRRKLTGHQHYLEIPLSTICEIPEVQDFFLAIIDQADVFAGLCNQVLADYRRLHHIQNRANPFPDLTVDGDAVELPFWLLDRQTGTRTALRVKNGEHYFEIQHETSWLKFSISGDINLSALASGRFCLVPKAWMTTLLLRLLGSDFFIHGRGGAAYDRFTDLFAARFYGMMLPVYATVSADRYLLVREIEQCEQARGFLSQYREMLYRPDGFVENNSFPAELAAALDVPLVQKKDYIQQLKIETTRQGRAAAAKAIKHVDDAIKALIEQYFGENYRAAVAVDGLYKDSTLWFREFPFFLFV